jgi:predicted NUDIX family phosphoesterase
MDERVLVIPRQHLEAVGFFRGHRQPDSAFETELLSPAQFSFRPRAEVETDPSYLQVIPYVVLKFGASLFHYRRGLSGGETRLRALRSVGIGGHISEEDARGGQNPLETGLLREVSEEVDVDEPRHHQSLGLIFDDSTPVGEVRLGVVRVWELAKEHAVPKEDSLAAAGFAHLATLRAEADEFETWSRFVLAGL